MSDARPSRPFHVMAKPAGPACNLDCAYCYYKDKASRVAGRRMRMEGAVLEAFVRDTIACQTAWQAPEIVFAWQGGEPTLLGVDYFRRIVALQERYRPKDRPLRNALQTNGVLLDREWAGFLRDHDFLVGISIDGPSRIHDRYRRDAKGRPSFTRAMAGLAALRDNGVEFNTLTTVHRGNAGHGRAVYRFLKKSGARFMQFIPIVERSIGAGDLAGPPVAGEIVGDGDRPVTPWSVPPAGFGRFLCDVFDEWRRGDVGRVFVQLFDVALGRVMGQPAGLCVFAETCGDALALEHDGNVYACDHYVYPDYRLGNIADSTLAELAGSPQQRRFGAAKRDALPRLCRDCRFLFMCNGGCPKHRFARAPDGAPGLNYLCPSYTMFFAHTAPAMAAMAGALRQGRPAAGAPGLGPRKAAIAGAKIGRNDPCPCASGRKFKLCCGAA